VASRRLDSSAGLVRHQFGSRFGILLLAGIAIRPVALLSGALLLAFGIGGMVGTGVRTALDASAFAAAAGALLLAVQRGHNSLTPPDRYATLARQIIEF